MMGFLDILTWLVEICDQDTNWFLYYFYSRWSYLRTTCGLLILCHRKYISLMRMRQNGCHFGDDFYKCIFLNENVWIFMKISLKFVPKYPINNISALVQIMARCLRSDKPFSESVMVSFLMHICVTRPQWVNTNEKTSHTLHPHGEIC